MTGPIARPYAVSFAHIAAFRPDNLAENGVTQSQALQGKMLSDTRALPRAMLSRVLLQANVQSVTDGGEISSQTRHGLTDEHEAAAGMCGQPAEHGYVWSD